MCNKIDCVAITDHNVADWIDRLKDAYSHLQDEAPADFRPLYLFPGVEISVYGNVHLLAIFDPDFSASDVTRFLGAAGLQRSRPNSNHHRTEKTLPEVSRLICDRNGIAIPAHVDKKNGVFHTAHQASFSTLANCRHIHAIEVVDQGFLETDNLEPLLRSKPAVLGSDSHHPSGAAGQRFPGSQFTWVKMGTPSIEGLRLALLDSFPLSIQRSDARQDNPNVSPNVFIKELSITNAQYAGRGATLSVRFSPWLTAIIGGRGTGKSTLVEMMRICLRREDEIPAMLKQSLKRFVRVPKSRSDSGALTGDTCIDLIIEKESTTYRLQWDTKGMTPAISRLGDANRWISEPGEIRNRFRIRLFSQRQILELANDPHSILQMVDESEAVNGTDFRNRQDKLQTTFLSLRSQIRKLNSNTTRRNRLLGELADIEQKIRIIEQGKKQEVLVTHRRIRRQSVILKRLHKELIQTVNDIRALAEEAEPANVPEDAFCKTDLGELKALQWYIEATQAQSATANNLRNTADNLEVLIKKWKSGMSQTYRNTRSRAKRRFRELSERFSRAGIRGPDQYVSLLQRRQALQQDSEQLERDRDTVVELREAAKKAILDLVRLRKEWNSKRESFLKDILRENKHVQVEIVPFGRGPHEQEPGFRSVLQREDGRLSDYILSRDGSRGLLADLYRDLPRSGSGRAEELLSRVSQLKKRIRQSHKASGKSWLHQHINKLQPEQIDRIELWCPSDSVKVSFKRPDGQTWSPIDGGSPGQQSAALLALILADGTEPLILDQPEDDLDNRLVSDLIVRQVRRIKRVRQIIVVTHNPNIVVNGDAEGVVEMDFRKGQCVVVREGTGCLQDRGTRNTICRVMEGGIDAFEARHKRLAITER